ncbi:hypothetical protein CAEBREN_18399 [Caenorhabditis brenneri]|uniref:Uncharacterized protein n=1 Tax=Caenorhabditis brenneri TaxID=135651 RepID=G0N598_CAEBE|nr:hypothetical protein CAEBREN_18399 [Caenorhabditis brenneri]
MSSAEKLLKDDLMPKKACGITKNAKRKGEALEKKILEITTRRSNGNSSVKSEQNADTRKRNPLEATGVAKTERIQEELDSELKSVEKMPTNVDSEERIIKSKKSEDAERTILPKECQAITKNEESSKGVEEYDLKSGIVEKEQHVSYPAKRQAMTKKDGTSIPRRIRQRGMKSGISDNESDFEEVPLKKPKNIQTSNTYTSSDNVAAMEKEEDSPHNLSETNSNLPQTSLRRSKRKASSSESELKKEAKSSATAICNQPRPDTSRLFEDSQSRNSSEESSSEPKLVEAVESETIDDDFEQMQQNLNDSSNQSQITEQVKPEPTETSLEKTQGTEGSLRQLNPCGPKHECIENKVQSTLPGEQPTISQQTVGIEETKSRSKPADAGTNSEIVESPFDYEAWLERMNNIKQF